MSNDPQSDYQLDRRIAVPALIGDHRDLLIIAGLAGASRDVAALTDDAANTFTMAGAMGAATMMGLGLAIAQPQRTVVVVTGDGELLMNLGALATIGVAAPTNLAIICVDNRHYGETGYQQSHTAFGVDLGQIATGAGINTVRTLADIDQVRAAAPLLREGNSCRFFWLQVSPNDPPPYKRCLNAAECRTRFRTSLADG